jgi:hypothetical protein
MVNELRALKADPDITPETVKAAERFLAEVKRLNRQLRRTVAIEGLCDVRADGQR